MKIIIKNEVINKSNFPTHIMFGISIYRLINRCLINEIAWVMLSARKNIQAKTVKENVSKIFPTSLMLGKTFFSAAIFKLFRFVFNSNKGKK
tara:strand:- start:3 stop:278 length:276 start_codon:yes stop_codon:yes gene_type:complete